MNVRKILVVSVCFLLVFSLGLTTFGEVQAASKKATLKEIKGEVTVQKGGGKKEIKAFEGMGVTQGDTVRTGKNSSVKVVLDDKNETLLGAGTKILISELVGNNTAIKQSSGGLWNKVKGTMNAGDSYEVETPTSIMGVRGTLFLAQVGPDGRMTLSVLDGIVGMNRPSSGSPTPEQAVGVDEQVSTGSGGAIPTPSPLDIPQFVQGTDVTILVQIILDELEAAREREQQASENERLYGITNLQDYMTGAVQEAHLASLLANIAESIMREVEQSSRYEEVQQVFRDRGTSWERTYQEVRNTVQQTERKKAEIERAAERERILQERQDQLRKELQNKIDRHRSGQSTSTPASPSTGGGGGGSDSGGGNTPTPEPTVWIVKDRKTDGVGGKIIIKAKDFNKNISAVQVHLGLNLNEDFLSSPDIRGKTLFSPDVAAYNLKENNRGGEDEIIFVQMLFGSKINEGVSVQGETTVAEIWFDSFPIEGYGEVQILDAIFVDNQGNKVSGIRY